MGTSARGIPCDSGAPTRRNRPYGGPRPPYGGPARAGSRRCHVTPRSPLFFLMSPLRADDAAGCPSGQRERSVKPSAQPTQVQVLHLPHQQEEARHQRKRGVGPLVVCPALYGWRRRSTARRGQYAAKFRSSPGPWLGTYLTRFALLVLWQCALMIGPPWKVVGRWWLAGRSPLCRWTGSSWGATAGSLICSIEWALLLRDGSRSLVRLGDWHAGESDVKDAEC